MTELQNLQRRVDKLARAAAEADITRNPFAQTLLQRYVSAKAALQTAKKSAGFAGLTFAGRMLALYSEADLRSRGWDIEAMKSEVAQ